ncbi:MAG: ATP-binding cassette domain-containing protein [Firmicutes bacterium]|nr:ATP-binding cassette domain-containing protein [Bacillota bacterium]
MIEVKNLTKKYGSFTAVDNISFTVGEGEILGFLGPNGAGKTTTMNMMTGFISSSSGSIKINGFDMLDDALNAKKQLGYMPDVPPLYGDMTVREYLEFVFDIKKVKKSDRQTMLQNICALTGITPMLTRLCSHLSKGYKQRVSLAQALVGMPDVLILDEPTSGLDPKQIIDIRNLIKRLGEHRTIIISSHILSEVSAVCDRVIIINEGKIAAMDTVENFSKDGSASKQIVSVKCGFEEAKDILSNWNAVDKVYLKNEEEGVSTLKVVAKEGKDIREIIFAAFAQREIPIIMLKDAENSLEEAFLNIIKGEYTPENKKPSEDEE